MPHPDDFGTVWRVGVAKKMPPKIEIFSRDKNILPLMHETSNIFGHSATTIAGFWVSLNYPILNFKKTVYPKNVWMQQCSCQKNLEKNYRRSVFSEALAGCKKFFKGFLPFILTKFLILKTSVTCIFRNMHFLCAKKLSSRSSKQRLILKYQGNLVIKFNDHVMKFI